MGLFDSLFGSKEEEIDPGVPVTTNVATKTPEQTELSKQLNLLLGGIAGGGGRVQGFQGDLTAGSSGLQNQAFDSLNQLFAQGGQSQNLIQDALSPFNEQGTIDRFNKFIAPAGERRQNTNLDRILERFAGVGLDSGAARRAVAESDTTFNLGQQEQLGNLLFAEEGRQQNRQFSGLNALLGIQGAGLQGGGVQRGIEQQGLDAQLQEFIRTQGIDPLLGLTPTALGVDTFDTTIQQPAQQFGQSTGSQIGNLLRGGVGLAKGIKSFF